MTPRYRYHSHLGVRVVEIDKPQHTLNPTACPMCRYTLDAASQLGGNAAPKPGDFSVCLNCGALLRFNLDLSLAMALVQELDALDAETRTTLLRARSAIRQRGPLPKRN